ncbi:HEAT repeat domain-containing protein [Microbacterium imperiale]|uniref:HEAT repeat domain-containing protein n=1 Tax=Microbacterium imperiale TaxID=33884 RepID=A0A9W6M3B0_9MICO|nr:HEAT repeat domain-containing protein [Microbacterium imperiale]MBP2422040.1 HEAT repeat protein [Microbacterium imperiale]MDS0200197.1 HEAT repeat domain-containing protein [Microbacterium imperiale]BFE39347.1 HEAT repeat domain-containing protein [Microbacterium imperiale]GLJ79786.1 hypothetical protein GCM10017586_14680 [Microbacterium imperiale]
MSEQTEETASGRLRTALNAGDGSSRVQSALAAGTYPRPEYVAVLVEQCAHEPDFTVRETLTWALTRQDRDTAVASLLPELRSVLPQARRQALHTLSKIGDPRAWPAITTALLHDDDPEVAQTAWRTAAGLAPDEAKPALADELAVHFGAGTEDLRRSLTRAFLMIGSAGRRAVDAAAASDDWDVRVHALATDHLFAHPDDGFASAIAAARRSAARRDAADWDEQA